MSREDRTYYGPYSKLSCPHCKTLLEAGPMLLAKWAWCVHCQKPCHDKWPCNEKCPKVRSGWDKWELRRDADNAQELIAKPWRK